MPHKPQTFIFFGPQGSGKGTQVEKLIEYLRKESPDLGIYQSDTGKRMREIIESKSFFGNIMKASLESGELQPIFIPTWIWAQSFYEKLTGSEHIILDGSPRTILEAELIAQAMKFLQKEPFIISIELSEEESYKRLLMRGRSDDSNEGIQRRLELYKNMTIPAREFLSNQPGFTTVHINGEQSIEDVCRDIIKELEKHFTA